MSRADEIAQGVKFKMRNWFGEWVTVVSEKTFDKLLAYAKSLEDQAASKAPSIGESSLTITVSGGGGDGDRAKQENDDATGSR